MRTNRLPEFSTRGDIRKSGHHSETVGISLTQDAGFEESLEACRQGLDECFQEASEQNR